jgi:hypothetical protein
VKSIPLFAAEGCVAAVFEQLASADLLNGKILNADVIVFEWAKRSSIDAFN